MGTVQLLTACAAMYVFVGLKSFQQRNVAHDHLLPIVPVSVGMAYCEFYVIAMIAVHGFSVAAATFIGVSAGLGSITAIKLHRRMFRR